MDPIDAAVIAAEARLDAHDPVGAARCIERYEDARGQHERLAIVWARLLPAVGNAKVLERQIRTLAAEWPRHPVVALTVAEAGTRWADPWPIDDTTDRLAALAVDVIERCIADGRLPERWIAPLHLARARALARVGPNAEDEALAAFEVGLQADPADATGWADLARLHQVRCRWPKGLAAAEHALGLDPAHRPARWTAAVCSTALGHPSAADHWRAVKHLSTGTDPLGRPRVDGLPPVEVLLDRNVLGAARRDDSPRAEVVWVHPTSPVHGRIASPTALDLPADFDDVVLWDPIPRGFRVVGESEVPCFTALTVLGGARARCWRVTVDPTTDTDPMSWPRGWRLYRFDDRVTGIVGSGEGKLVTPAGVERTRVVEALTARGLRVSDGRAHTRPG